jgi:hypothetical protein
MSGKRGTYIFYPFPLHLLIPFIRKKKVKERRRSEEEAKSERRAILDLEFPFFYSRKP